jgi:DNA-binding MarR family transcriptional regulator
VTRPVEREVWQALRALVLDDDRRQEVSEVLGMSFVRAKALRLIAGGAVPMRDLVSALGTDAAYTTVVLDDLENRGFVTRAPHPDDRRAKIVTATATGRRAARKADSILGRPPASFTRLSAADLAELDRIITLLTPGTS